MSGKHGFFKRGWGLYTEHLGSYMRRWIARSPFGTMRLHNIRESDDGRDHHDHPFDFTSLILKGGYVEHRPECTCFGWIGQTTPDIRFSPCRYYGPGSIVRRRAEDFHRLELPTKNGKPVPAWTLVLAGPYRREWGFLLKDGTWQKHEDYKERVAR